MSALLLTLDDDTFGDLLRRARDYSGIRIRDAATKISDFERTSHQRLLNLELLADPPSDAGRRVLAVLAAVTYGFDPAVFGLEWSYLPRRIDRADVISALAPQPGATNRVSRRFIETSLCEAQPAAA